MFLVTYVQITDFTLHFMDRCLFFIFTYKEVTTVSVRTEHCVCVQLTSVSRLLHFDSGCFMPLTVDALCVSDGDSTVQPRVSVPEDLTAEAWGHSVVWAWAEFKKNVSLPYDHFCDKRWITLNIQNPSFSASNEQEMFKDMDSTVLPPSVSLLGPQLCLCLTQPLNMNK